MNEHIFYPFLPSALFLLLFSSSSSIILLHFSNLISLLKPITPGPYVQLYPSLPWDLCTDSSIAKLPITASPSPTMHHLAVIAPCAPHAALRAPPALPCSSSSPYSHRNHLSRAGARPAPRPALQHFPKAVAPPPFRAPWNSGMRSRGAQLALGGRERNK